LSDPHAKTSFHLASIRVVREGKPILRITDLAIRAGETTAIVGPSGAGKSTLLRVLAGLERPDDGEVCSWGPHGNPLLPGQVVMVFQRPILLHGTVEENIAVGLRLRGERVKPERLRPVMDRLGLAAKLRQPVRTLSGGEYQRAALARAMVLEPTALLLDEPTANLDPENVALVEGLVRDAQLERGMTVVWVTHNPVQARRVGHSVVLIAGGEVVEHACVDHFFSDDASPQTQDFLAGRMVW
jgi:tungstate transport system ATP-binding protein